MPPKPPKPATLQKKQEEALKPMPEKFIGAEGEMVVLGKVEVTTRTVPGVKK